MPIKERRFIRNDKPDELRPEYSKSDLGRGMGGKHYQDFSAGTNLVLLSPDVATMFKDEKSVNDALRFFIKLAQKAVEKTNHSI